MKCEFCAVASCAPRENLALSLMLLPHVQLPQLCVTLGTCQELAGGGGWKQSQGHNFSRLRKGRGREKWAVKRERVMQIYARDHVEVHPQKTKEVFYSVK